jgi:uncharacterized protein YutE (UPF0331/DUF86 family)
MDKAVLCAKMEALQHCVARIQSHMPPSVEKLVEDFDVQDILSVNLERAVQLCVDIAAHILADHNAPAPQTMAACFEELRKEGYLPAEVADHLKKAIGFRNISVHAYQDIDWAIVFSIVTTRLTDFSDFARHINARLKLW